MRQCIVVTLYGLDRAIYFDSALLFNVHIYFVIDYLTRFQTQTDSIEKKVQQQSTIAILFIIEFTRTPPEYAIRCLHSLDA